MQNQQTQSVPGLINHIACAKLINFHLLLANTLNGLRVLFCTFEGRNPCCIWLVDQLQHVFARAMKFAHVLHTETFSKSGPECH